MLTKRLPPSIVRQKKVVPMVFRRIFVVVLVAAVWTQPGWSFSDVPSCGDSVEDAIASARQAANNDNKDHCLTVAIERLADHVEALRTGRASFGTIRAEVYRHGGDDN